LSNSVEFPAGFATLGNERQAIAHERIQDSIIANAPIGVVILAASALPLVLAVFVLRGAHRDQRGSQPWFAFHVADASVDQQFKGINVPSGIRGQCFSCRCGHRFVRGRTRQETVANVEPSPVGLIDHVVIGHAHNAVTELAEAK
jgi:hypothetical protein